MAEAANRYTKNRDWETCNRYPIIQQNTNLKTLWPLVEANVNFLWRICLLKTKKNNAISGHCECSVLKEIRRCSRPISLCKVTSNGFWISRFFPVPWEMISELPGATQFAETWVSSQHVAGINSSFVEDVTRDVKTLKNNFLLHNDCFSDILMF